MFNPPFVAPPLPPTIFHPVLVVGLPVETVLETDNETESENI